jgi:hypothetical protein
MVSSDHENAMAENEPMGESLWCESELSRRKVMIGNWILKIPSTKKSATSFFFRFIFHSHRGPMINN